jgi:protein-S-isoprenylcysteine O-methyltransferase Ste14
MTLPHLLLRNRLALTRVTAIAIVAAYWLLRVQPALGALAGGTALVALGQGLRLWAAGHLVKRDVLTITGPFAHTRHPLYWGSTLSGLGLCVACRMWWSYLLVGAVFTLFYMPTLLDEEAWLRQAYGDAYRRYSEAVPRFGVRLRGYRGGEGPPSEARRFSWSRAFANGEHRTIAATLILLAALWLRLAVAGGAR